MKWLFERSVGFRSKMISKVSAVSAVLFVYFSVAVTAETINCFQCNTATDIGCADLTANHTNSPYYRDCNATQARRGATPFCRKTKMTLMGNTSFVRIIRECGWLLHKNNITRCYEIDTDAKFEISCQCFEDGCNNAPVASTPSSLLFVVITTILGSYYRYC